MKFIIALLLLSQAGCATYTKLFVDVDKINQEHLAAQANRTPEQIKADNIRTECGRKAYAASMNAYVQQRIVTVCLADKGL